MEEKTVTGQAPDIVAEHSAIHNETDRSPVAQPQGCPGNCKLCTMMQHTYCAAQMCVNTQNIIATLMTKVDALTDEIGKLKQNLTKTKQTEQPLVDAPQPKKTKKPAK